MRGLRSIIASCVVVWSVRVVASAQEPEATTSDAPEAAPADEAFPSFPLDATQGAMETVFPTIADNPAPATAPAYAWSSTGEVAFESRAFLPDHHAQTKDGNAGLFARLGFGAQGSHVAFKARGFARGDAVDRRRSLAVLEELWVEAKNRVLSLRVGADILNWSATEAFHPADIVNARNIDSDIERYEKLGEPMAQLSARWPRGSLTALAFPLRMHPLLPSYRSRLSPVPLGVKLGDFIYLDDQGKLSERRVAAQGGLLWRQTVGHADLTLHVLHHTDRSQPAVYLDPVRMMPRPLLQTVSQVGATYQQVFGPLIVKFEGAYRKFVPPADGTGLGPTLRKRDHLQLAVGLEYGWLIGNVESTFLLEAQSIFLPPKPVRTSLQVFQRDLMATYRLVFSDTGASTLQLTGIIDLEDPSQVLGNFSFTRRLVADLQISLAVRLVFGRNEANVGLPSNSDHVRLFLTRYF